MGKIDWSTITRKDVIKAIRIFVKDNLEYPEPKSTFLLFEGKKLPAKHIRGMAYKVVHGIEVSKNDYAGGMETVRFFRKLGFDMFYNGEILCGNSQQLSPDVNLPEKSSNDILQNTLFKNPLKIGQQNTISIKMENEKEERKGLKIGLYLQTQTDHNPEAFQRIMNIVSDTVFDILVFPEDCYCPEIEELWQLDIAQKEDVEQIREYCLSLSRQINKAVVFSPFDKYCTPYSVFANYKADETETEFAVYIKHTMAESSVFEFDNYKEIAREMFRPIIYKGYKIGMTICYDCNHAPFSRMWGINGVDIILNSTGGDVVYDKWYKYNKVRAIENQCYNFVTMGGAGTNNNAHTYVYGFNPEGGELPFHNLMSDTDRTNEINTVYVYDTSLDNREAQVENSLYQKETANKHQDYFFPVEHMHTVLEQAEKIDANIRILSYQGNTLVFCMIEGLSIMHPEYPLRLLYSDKLKEYQNKRYILINYHKKEIEQNFFETKLSIVLKVRAMENFCAVILESPNIKHCYQTGNNRTAQVIPAENGYYGIDISRTSGPEAIWKNKQGMKSDWRNNFEWLISQIQDKKCSNV